MEETWIPLLCIWHSVDRISNLIVEVIEHWQTVLGLECIYEVLCGLMEIPSARPDTPTSIQHVTPVSTTVKGVVILVA